MVDGWKYYNHAAVPSCAPHEEADITSVLKGVVWNNLEGGRPLLARWTTDWDCGVETSWWYIIKSESFDISLLKSKRRYEINKGNRNFEVRNINPNDYVDDIYRVTVAAYSEWPEKYRPTVTVENIKKKCDLWSKHLVFGAYSIKNQVFNGYAIIEDYGSYAAFSVLRTNPEAEKEGINAAIIYSVLTKFNDRFHDGFYICDGARSIWHETAFQEYLEKYFAFRKAFCKLNIRYRPGIGLAVKILYPFRSWIKGNSRIGSQLRAVLRMEEYANHY